MDLDFTDDQEALRTALREFFAKEAGPAVVRAAEPLGFDAKLWRRAVELGLPTMAVPEALGGGGAGFVELAVAAELVGRTLAPIPLVESSVAAHLLASVTATPGALGTTGTNAPEVAGSGRDSTPKRGRNPALSGEEECDGWVEGVVGGKLLATIALSPVTGGVARLVPAAAVADLVVALRGDQLLLVRQEPPGEAPANLGAMPVADVSLDNAQVIASGAEAVAVYDDAVSRWKALTAVALYGLGARALELGIEYARQRHAFGILIGSFQALQHTLADDVTDLEGARLLAYKAAWSHDAGESDRREITDMAVLFAADRAFRTASDALHVHGGYGFTLEYDPQLYFRRAKAWSLIAGDRRHAYAGLAHRLYDRVEA